MKTSENEGRFYRRSSSVFLFFIKLQKQKATKVHEIRKDEHDENTYGVDEYRVRCCVSPMSLQYTSSESIHAGGKVLQ